MKKAFTKHKRNHATFMYIPESESKVISLRIPLWAPKAVVLSLTLLIITTSCLFYIAASLHDKYSISRNEISSLAAVNSTQKQEIQKLQNDAVQIQQQLEDNMKALDEIKEAVGLKKSDSQEKDNAVLPSTKDSSGSTSSNTLQQIDQIKTSYQSLSAQVLSQRLLIDSSMSSVKKQVAYLNAMPSIAPVITRISDTYGYRKNPFTNRGTEFHKGMDFSGPEGTPIRATGDGVVTFAGWQAGYGKVVVISHGYGITTLYGHNSKLLVSKGDKIKKEQVISKMGSTGRSTGTHLHYEVRVNGTIVNPAKYIK